MGFLLVDSEWMGQPRLRRLWAKTERGLSEQGQFYFGILLIKNRRSRPAGLITKGKRTGCLPQLIFLRVHLDHLLSIARVGLSGTPIFEIRTRPVKDRWLIPPNQTILILLRLIINPSTIRMGMR